MFFCNDSLSTFDIISLIWIFLFLASFKTSFVVFSFILLVILSLPLNTNSPAPNAHAPIAREGSIPTDNPKYGTAKKVPPYNRWYYWRILHVYIFLSLKMGSNLVISSNFLKSTNQI